MAFIATKNAEIHFLFNLHYRDSKGEALEPIPIIISAGHEPEQ